MLRALTKTTSKRLAIVANRRDIFRDKRGRGGKKL